MATILSKQETNLIESIIKNYGQVSFEYDAVMDLIKENRELKFLTDEFADVVESNAPNAIKPDGQFGQRFFAAAEKAGD